MYIHYSWVWTKFSHTALFTVCTPSNSHPRFLQDLLPRIYFLRFRFNIIQSIYVIQPKVCGHLTIKHLILYTTFLIHVVKHVRLVKLLLPLGHSSQMLRRVKNDWFSTLNSYRASVAWTGAPVSICNP